LIMISPSWQDRARAPLSREAKFFGISDTYECSGLAMAATNFRGQSAKLFLKSSELGLPHPLPAGECAPPSYGRGGGGWGVTHSFAAGEEVAQVGESQFRRGDRHCVVL
jgi:hypothetical protein